MSYRDDGKNVERYVEMTAAYDGRGLVEVLRRHLPEGLSVLELGMGPGKDLAILGETYQVTGSDVSRPFVDRYLATHPDVDVLVLDGATLETDRTFDGVYSNKAPIHLGREALAASFARQAEELAPGGVGVHSFWVGEGEETFAGLLSVYHTEATLRAAMGDALEIVEMTRYAEDEEGDSLHVVVWRT